MEIGVLKSQENTGSLLTAYTTDPESIQVERQNY